MWPKQAKIKISNYLSVTDFSFFLKQMGNSYFCLPPPSQNKKINKFAIVPRGTYFREGYQWKPITGLLQCFYDKNGSYFKTNHNKL